MPGAGLFLVGGGAQPWLVAVVPALRAGGGRFPVAFALDAADESSAAAVGDVAELRHVDMDQRSRVVVLVATEWLFVTWSLTSRASDAMCLTSRRVRAPSTIEMTIAAIPPAAVTAAAINVAHPMGISAIASPLMGFGTGF
ncbi:hypothetical protein Lxx24240 [Leifsonia xyli subsp. xyli str. CTCB07]|uniref:Uncharacterized protein n=1 Tax=Leifsonia xyli subsp. xyli (strain CTCB07) TaxID=281090 RepID=Q6AC36_LEIXX|nr:hypothetical protein Lxx24240 [Leifsonia xyli subsp. xyli str. CTCB07]